MSIIRLFTVGSRFLLSSLLLTASLTIQAAAVATGPEQVKPLLNGQTVPAGLMLKDSAGKPQSLNALLAEQNTVLVFYRGGWCPYCNLQLAGLRDITPALQKLGYRVVAISPQAPEAAAKSEQSTQDAALNYQLYSDDSLQAMQAFGVAYYMDGKTEQTYKNSYGIKLTYDASGQAVLPVPAVFILDRSGTVQFSYSHINYKTRLQPRLLLLAAELAVSPQS